MDRTGEEIGVNESQEYPYATFLNVLYPSLSVVDVPSFGRSVDRSLVQPNAVQGQRLGCSAGCHAR